jgi:hypothetical protein
LKNLFAGELELLEPWSHFLLARLTKASIVQKRSINMNKSGITLSVAPEKVIDSPAILVVFEFI